MRLLRACEAAMERLATDRHYFAHPVRTLFNDVRSLFPIADQLRVYRSSSSTCEAVEYVDSQLRDGVTFDGSPACCHATTREGTPASAFRCRGASTARRTSTSRRTSRWPRPSDRSQATCRLRVVVASRRDPRGRRRRDLHRRRAADRRRGSSRQGAHHARRPVRGRDRRGEQALDARRGARPATSSASCTG